MIQLAKQQIVIWWVKYKNWLTEHHYQFIPFIHRPIRIDKSCCYFLCTICATMYNGRTKVHDRSHNPTNALMWSHDGSHIIVQHSQKLHDYTAIYKMVASRLWAVATYVTVTCSSQWIVQKPVRLPNHHCCMRLPTIKKSYVLMWQAQRRLLMHRRVQQSQTICHVLCRSHACLFLRHSLMFKLLAL